MEFVINNLANLGLIIDIIGASILWKFGLHTALIDNKEINEVVDGGLILSVSKDESSSDISIVKRLSKIGLLLLVFGFIFQGIGNTVSSEKNYQIIESIVNKSIQLENIKREVVELEIKFNSQIAMSSENINKGLKLVSDRVKSIEANKQKALRQANSRKLIKNASNRTNKFTVSDER